MFINLNHITEKGIEINQQVDFEPIYYKKTAIKGLENVIVKGKIYYSETSEVIFEGNVSGVMKLQDANTGELINYKFSADVNEILAENENIKPILRTNIQNSLDLKEVLWQNIVLEVPIRISESLKPKTTKGEGWELVDENSKREDPRLECFKALLEKGKE
jgi:uncharacterized metal-binding protein YceD (DUF177 family)